MTSVVLLSGASPTVKRGVPRVCLNHAHALANRGLRVSIFAHGPRTGREWIEGIEVNTFAYESGENSLLNVFRMRKACRKGWDIHYGRQSPDVIHGHDPLTFLFIASLLPRNVRKVFTVHDPLLYHQRMLNTSRFGMVSLLKSVLFAGIERSVYRSSDYLHAISHYTLERMLPVPSSKSVKVVHNWVDVVQFTAPDDKRATRNELGLADEFVVYTLRALEQRMGLANLVAGFDRFHCAVPNSRLVIAGKGPLLAQLQRQVEALGLVDVVSFLGYVSDVAAVSWYQAADVVVVPSIDGEGFGLPILEAMACGTPALGTPVCAIPEVLHGKVDRLLPGTAPEHIAEGLLAYYHHWTAQRPCPSEERQYVLDRFAEQHLVPQIMEDYDDAFKRTGDRQVSG